MTEKKSTRALNKQSRHQAILEALATQLELHPGQRITTAQLAESLEVSEAALYRHFPSKARMFEGLIEFSEDTVFGLIRRILDEDDNAVSRCEKIMALILGFSAKNPGISSVLVGTALTGETERLRQRVSQFFDRLETQFRQILRERELTLTQAGGRPVNETANLLLSIVEGRLQQFVRSGFRQSPLQGWEQQWQLINPILRTYA
ncbi:MULTISPECIES: nucleoid occlusion factor SlmA [unclassified Methylophaga]|jgi:TetR/AcrR family transcriptional regulator|uniref:nucleoid occlusion factor SlmA n=1 Tax=unclassified Methylophaga TaxID=2629249 RepID=UPI000C8B3A58|nr:MULTISPECIES: nucleoid occlusion factor SlmA [unclassified Methylophaga]MAK67403.1 nucleoid occlusion factor SlmA [Methylophaga sp.]MAY16943.1 nucleoid occlusion factor SlmA [Methylophaga sp.]MBN46542.1 nucleoid occlusion factor SlmA [Methylophaga sp.]HAO24257.1 nucleoid occlusion factor SlmA [Methylophaga sp.]HCD03827.1 nucleoid occlusion factor SlmA [Methylophaga sp.]|tara:strand:- start:66038 stop:66652 length:615 start_codon:yes stop_codon:yes gene_type:complete